MGKDEPRRARRLGCGTGFAGWGGVAGRCIGSGRWGLVWAVRGGWDGIGLFMGTKGDGGPTRIRSAVPGAARTKDPLSEFWIRRGQNRTGPRNTSGAEGPPKRRSPS